MELMRNFNCNFGKRANKMRKKDFGWFPQGSFTHNVLLNLDTPALLSEQMLDSQGPPAWFGNKNWRLKYGWERDEWQYIGAKQRRHATEATCRATGCRENQKVNTFEVCLTTKVIIFVVRSAISNIFYPMFLRISVPALNNREILQHGTGHTLYSLFKAETKRSVEVSQ